MNYFFVIAIFISIFGVDGGDIFTSVWCHGSHQTHRHCTFNNLCYSPRYNQFLFFHSAKESVISGIDSPGEQIRLARLSTIEGLEDNVDDLFMDYTMLPSSVSRNYNITFDDNHSIFVKRWKPTRLSSVFHDDLIPMFFTMKFLCYGDSVECLDKYQVVIADSYGKDTPHESIYTTVLSPAKFVYLNEMATSDEKSLVCFSKSIVGLETETIWYDYGFYLNGRQGPRENPNLRIHYIEEFRNFAVKNLQKIAKVPSKSDVIFLLPDLKWRLKNSEELANILQKLTREALGPSAKFEIFDPDEGTFVDLVIKCSQAKMLIGLTGELMIASLFLPQGSSTVELFPYGLDPQVSSLIQALCSIRGIVYHSWVNHIRRNSVSHPELEPEFGGLAHLDPTVQRGIEAMEYVGDVKCCDDPAYLHKFYQETDVDIDSFKQAVQNGFEDMALKEAEFLTEQITKDEFSTEQNVVDEWMLPSKVFDASCTLKKSDDRGTTQVFAEVIWNPPLNLQYIPHKSVIYEVTSQAELFSESNRSELVGEFSTRENSVSFSFSADNLKKFKTVNVWIAVLLDHDLRGTDTFVRCNMDSLLLM